MCACRERGKERYQNVRIKCPNYCACISDALMSVRHSLVTSKMTGATSPIKRPSLNEHCSTLYASIKSGLEASLTKVKEFIASTVSFSMRNEFRREFCMTNVRSGIVMTFINFVLDTCEVQIWCFNNSSNCQQFLHVHMYTWVAMFAQGGLFTSWGLYSGT